MKARKSAVILSVILAILITTVAGAQISYEKATITSYQVVNLGTLQKAIDDKKLDAGKVIDAEAMLAAGLFKNAADGVRLLGKGELKVKIEVKVAGASASAIAAVEKAGGKVELPPKPVAEAA